MITLFLYVSWTSLKLHVGSSEELRTMSEMTSHLIPGIIGLSKSVISFGFEAATSLGVPLSLLMKGDDPAFIKISTRRMWPC